MQHLLTALLCFPFEIIGICHLFLVWSWIVLRALLLKNLEEYINFSKTLRCISTMIICCFWKPGFLPVTFWLCSLSLCRACSRRSRKNVNLVHVLECACWQLWQPPLVGLGTFHKKFHSNFLSVRCYCVFRPLFNHLHFVWFLGLIRSFFDHNLWCSLTSVSQQ